ncbi:MAG: AAA family ATPase [Candidatus Zixiibacteriota bacterium]|nr:MAG: AAA family ATPase [candidate division Zixibacteria bacterium]
MNNRHQSDYRHRVVRRCGGPAVTALVSGKGGVGKSVICFNLGTTFASAGQETLLIDCDWHFGDLHILSNVVPNRTLGDVLSGSAPASECTTAIRGHLSLIAAPSVQNSGVTFDAVRFSEFMAGLRDTLASYDIILLDTPSGNLDVIKRIFDAADINLIVVNPEMTSIADSYGLFKYLADDGQHGTAHLLINRAQNNSDAEYIHHKLTYLAAKFLGKVPQKAGYLLDDKEIMRSVGLQKALCELTADSPALTGFSALSRCLAQAMPVSRSVAVFDRREQVNFEAFSADIRE